MNRLPGYAASHDDERKYHDLRLHVITVLADTAVRAENLDEAAILEARKNAETLLANQKSDLDSAAALAALAETAAQLETIRKIKNRAQ